jgi:hypothetical protein
VPVVSVLVALRADFALPSGALAEEASTLRIKRTPSEVLLEDEKGFSRFLYRRTEKDREGEVLAWVYACGDEELTIFND